MITSTGFRPTHKGWFWFCPVYLELWNHDAGLSMEERWAWLAPAFWVSLQLEQARIFLTSILAPDYEPSFGVIVTGELPARG